MTTVLVFVASLIAAFAGSARAADDLDRTVLPIAEPQPPTITTLDARDAEAPPRFQIQAPAGAPKVVVVLIDDERRTNAFGLLMSLNMLIEFGDAFDYTGADFDRWCREAGFSRTEVIPLGGPASAGVAYK